MEMNFQYWADLGTSYGLKILGAIVILVVGRWLVGLARSLARRLMQLSAVDKTLISFASNVVYGFGLIFVVIAALGQLGIETTSLAAILGAAGLAIGLSLQGSLANLAAGVMLIAMRPFQIGDVVETAGKSGTVEELNIFTTTLRTDQGESVIIPNGKITGDIIVNHSRTDL